LILTLAIQKYFCHFCAETTCPTFKPESVYTSDDVAFLRALKIAVLGMDKIEEYIEAPATCGFCAGKIIPEPCLTAA
jgi:hypothetical protein